MKIFKGSLFCIFLLLLANCTMAPFTEPHTAKTLGKGNNEWAGTLGAPSFGSVSYNRGVNDKFDLGVHIEYQNMGPMIGFGGKYLLDANEKEQQYVSLIFGGGLGTGYYGYFGPIYSRRFTPKYELAANFRMNVFTWDIESDDEQETEDWLDDMVDGVIEDLNGTYTYVSLDISNTFWIKENFGLTLSTSGMYFFGNLEGTGAKAGLKFHYKY